MALRHGAALALLPPLTLLYIWLNVHDGLGSLKGDGLIYLNTARHYAPYLPEDPVAAGWAAVTQFPPLYSVLLAATGGALDFRLAHGVTALCLLGAFAGFYAWLITLGVARARAALTVAVLALAPGTVLQSFYLHPEGLYAALAFVALVLLSLGESSRRAVWFWGAAAAVALAVLTRTVGVTLLPALLLGVMRSRPRGGPGMVAVAFVPGILWGLVHDPPSGYGDLLREQYASASASDLAQGAFDSIRATAAGLADNLFQNARLAWLAALLGAVAGVAAVRRLVDRRPDAWYLAAYLATLALWPFPQEAARLAWVAVPILLGYVVWAGERLVLRLPDAWPRIRPALVWMSPVVLALAVLPESLLLMARARHPVAQQHPAYRHLPQWYYPDLATAQWYTELHLGTVEALRRFEQRIPQDECVVTTLPLVAGFYVRRPTRVPPAESTGQGHFDEELQRTGCRYLLLTFASGRGGSEAPFYPLERLAGRVRLLDEHYIMLADGQRRRVAALGVLEPP